MHLAIAAAALMWATAHAGVTERAEFDYKRGILEYSFIALVEGSSNIVRAIITDYDRLHRLNEHIVESRVVERFDTHRLRRRLLMNYCILFYCVDLDFVEDIEETPATITMTVVSEAGNFEGGVASWRIEAVDETHTRVFMNAKQTPRFWIPPLIGPALLKRVFVKEVHKTRINLERIVKTMALEAAP